MVYKIKGFKIAKRLKFIGMRNIVVFSALLVSMLQISLVNAQDDVYDAPKPKQVKVKPSYTSPSEQQEKIIPVEKTQPYYEEGYTGSRMQSSSNGNNYIRNSDDYSNDYSSDFGYGYTDRIRRFHNNSFQFNYGWNNWNNNYYDPWNSFNNTYGWNNWNSYAFTPSWTFGYNNFYNPFCGNNQIIFVQPGFYNSWYNTGFCNPFSSWNNYGLYGFSPYCSNTIYNYGYSNYEGYYDQHRKNVVYTPRTGGYNNTNNITKGNNSNYNYNYPSNTNNTGGFTKGNTNQQQVAPATPTTKKWNNSTYNNSGNNSNNDNNDVYKYNNNRPANNNWNNNSTPAPSNNNNSNNSGNSGIKIGTRPK